MVDAIEPRPSFIIGINHIPWGDLGIGIGEHFIFGFAVFNPKPPGFQVHIAEFPAFQRVFDTLPEPVLLLFVTHRKPVLDQNDPGMDQRLLKAGT